MAKWYYYDSKGNPIGPVKLEAFRGFAAQGKITPETVIESDEGKRSTAGKIKGLVFKGKESLFPTISEIKSTFASPPPVEEPESISVKDPGFIDVDPPTLPRVIANAIGAPELAPQKSPSGNRYPHLSTIGEKLWGVFFCFILLLGAGIITAIFAFSPGVIVLVVPCAFVLYPWYVCIGVFDDYCKIQISLDEQARLQTKYLQILVNQIGEQP